MNLQTQAMNDVASNKGMMDDPNWTYQERQMYQAAYNAAKAQQQQ